MAGKFEMALDYIDVAERIRTFREQYPEGSLQQLSLTFESVAGGEWVVYTAAAYRTPDDQRPGHGTAWEPIPGKTPYTKDSEVQNAETAAWGRAIVAVLAADTKRGIASAQEVRNRQVDDVTTRMNAIKSKIVAALPKSLTKEEVLDEVVRLTGKQPDAWTEADLTAALAAIPGALDEAKAKVQRALSKDDAKAADAAAGS